MSKSAEFRKLLKENDYLYTTGVTGALDASIADNLEALGFSLGKE